MIWALGSKSTNTSQTSEAKSKRRNRVINHTTKYNNPAKGISNT